MIWIAEFFARAMIVSISVIFVIGILAMFFRLLTRLIPPKNTPAVISEVDTLFGEGIYEARLSSGECIRDLRFEGFVDVPSGSPASWPLRGMAAFRTADGKRVIIRVEAVRVFVEKLP